jgi:hypothetical protein
LELFEAITQLEAAAAAGQSASVVAAAARIRNVEAAIAADAAENEGIRGLFPPIRRTNSGG